MTEVVESVGGLTEAELLELCMNNGGEPGLWNKYSEQYKKLLHETSSEEQSSRRTAIVMATKLKISITQSKKLHEDLRNRYQPKN